MGMESFVGFFFFANIIEKLHRSYIGFKFISAALGFPCCLQALSSCGERGLLLLGSALGFLIDVAALV